MTTIESPDQGIIVVGENTTEPERPSPTQQEQVLSTIARAAADPSVDVEKLERLLAMQERILERQAELEFNRSMAACQQAMPNITRDSVNPSVKGRTHRYASFDHLQEIVKPIETRYGFTRSFGEVESPLGEGYKRILCYLSHVGGHTRIYTRDEPCDGKGAKGGDVMTRTHAGGSADSYGRRYMTLGIYNLTLEGSDDDGNAAGGTSDYRKQPAARAPRSEAGKRHAAPQDETPRHYIKVSADVASHIGLLCADAGVDQRQFCDWVSDGIAQSIEDLPDAVRTKAVRALSKRIREKAEKYADEQAADATSTTTEGVVDYDDVPF